MDLRFELLPSDQWKALTREWDGLNATLGGSPVLSFDFVSACVRHFAAGDVHMAIARTDAGATVAAAIGHFPAPGRWSTLQIAQAPLAFWLSKPELPVPELLAALVASAARVILVASIPQLDPAIIPIDFGDARVRMDPYIPTARIDVEGEWQSYWAGRGKNLKANHRKAMKRATQAGWEVELSVSQTPDELIGAVGCYGDLESKSWKAEVGTAVARENSQGKFFADLLGTLAATDRARAYTLLIDGKAAAIDLCVQSDDCLVVLKTTYSLDFKEMSPASLLRELYFEKVFDEGRIRRIEFYGRVMDWHTKWTSEIREIQHLTWYRFSALRRVHSALRALSRPMELQRVTCPSSQPH